MKLGRAFWKFYLDNLFFNLGTSLVFGVFFGILWGFLVFSSFGFFIGLIGYQYFYKEQFYFYHNLGWSKSRLILNVFLVNISISVFLTFILIMINA